MGRGRQKAKQTKVARDLKYRSVDTDFASLQRELANGSGEGYLPPAPQVDEDDDADEYGDYVDLYDTDDEDDEPARKSG